MNAPSYFLASIRIYPKNQPPSKKWPKVPHLTTFVGLDSRFEGAFEAPSDF
jgi:hypothetical protein